MPDNNLRSFSIIVLNISFTSFSLPWYSCSLYIHSLFCHGPIVLDIFCSFFPVICSLFSLGISIETSPVSESLPQLWPLHEGGTLFIPTVLSPAFPSGSFLGGHLSAHTAYLGCRLLSPQSPQHVSHVVLTSWPGRPSIFAVCGSEAVSLSSNCVFCLFLCFYRGVWVAEGSASGERRCRVEAAC